ncbi:hypothetical protein BV22DRAFT_1043721 [Leucogyrophana mollusca]|uniref:Uncharacterized protein n=1 Tax=Leucogyrophana mollusca TaxID=85980 RepID=A0ACB8BVR4_9AGAM|nr:hypothetical protein BV22DRAFT_1043721 [Leucogyrophana mollusca]
MFLKRAFATLIDVKGHRLPKDFDLYPNFFTFSEQRILLTTALQKLDATESRRARKRRKEFQSSISPSSDLSSSSLQDLFLPDDYYAFEEGHYDNVIRNYREMHVSSWPESEVSGLSSILSRLRTLHPTGDTQTHLLHLASTGEILPHVDNVSASGSWILGASLGAERIMRMESTSVMEDSFEVLLPSGSVYLQRLLMALIGLLHRDSVRFGYRHSILRAGCFRGREIDGGPRVSIMVRDRKAVDRP